ncbi:hypothetical protein [Clostridium tetani]
MNKNKERVTITKFLQWNDKNGCYTDENRDIEEFPRMTYKDAIKYFFGVINDDVYYKIVDNIFELTYEEAIRYAKEKGFYDTTIQKLNLLYNENKPTIEFYKNLI